jgi:hypothetical protein
LITSHTPLLDAGLLADAFAVRLPLIITRQPAVKHSRVNTLTETQSPKQIAKHHCTSCLAHKQQQPTDMLPGKYATPAPGDSCSCCHPGPAAKVLLALLSVHTSNLGDLYSWVTRCPVQWYREPPDHATPLQPPARSITQAIKSSGHPPPSTWRHAAYHPAAALCRGEHSKTGHTY